MMTNATNCTVQLTSAKVAQRQQDVRRALIESRRAQRDAVLAAHAAPARAMREQIVGRLESRAWAGDEAAVWALLTVHGL